MDNIFSHVKISLLKEDVIRFEYCPNDNFTNNETLFIKHKNLSNNNLDFSETYQTIIFQYLDYTFMFNKDNVLATLKVIYQNNVIYRYRKIENSGELPLPNKTPYIFPIIDTPRLIIPESGYVPNNEGYKLQKDVIDLYLLICNKDYLKLRKQYISITGINEMPRIKNFGLFASRYYKYNQKSACDMIISYKKHNLPLDTFVLDTDWRDMEKLAGCGYTVNTSLFPSIQDFYHFAHSNNIQVIMNDHPLPFKTKSTVLDGDEIEYRKNNLTNFYNLGLDGWWYDRNWTCKLNSIDRSIASESLGNYLFNDVTKQFHLGFVLDQEVYTRSFVMSNVNNIQNGWYQKILDSRSHIYSLQWSGDIFSDEQTLRNEIVSLKKCANNMIGYYSSDIGGHMGNPNRTQYIRWMEYGALSPVLRPHCTCSVSKFREPWAYDKKTLDICRNYINMRYRLLNAFYTASYKHVNNGLGICSPTYLYYPYDKRCYQNDTSYLIGSNILVSPITGADAPKSINSKNFTNKLRLSIYPNAEFKGPKCYTRYVKSFIDLNKFFNQIKAKYPRIAQFSLRFKGELLFKHEYQLSLRNSYVVKIYLNNKLVFDNSSWHYANFNEIAKIKRNKKTKLVVETTCGRKLNYLDLVYYKIKKNGSSKIYLPQGEWFNVSHRNVYQGNRYIKEKYKLSDTPIFVKAGSLIPLYKIVDNISNMSLKNIVYDYYCSKKETINDYFYEDDGISTGYAVGDYRKNPYHTYYENNSYFIKLDMSENHIDDGLRFRNVIFKAHIRDSETIDQVLINGLPIKFKRHDHKKDCVPFLDNEYARDSKTLTFKFKQNIKENYLIQLIIRK